MSQNVQEYCEKILELAREIEAISKYQEEFNTKLKNLDSFYQSKKFGYFKYKRLYDHLLKEKTHEEWNEYYSIQIVQSLKSIDYINSKIFFEIYEEKIDMTAPMISRPEPIEEPPRPDLKFSPSPKERFRKEPSEEGTRQIKVTEQPWETPFDEDSARGFRPASHGVSGFFSSIIGGIKSVFSPRHSEQKISSKQKVVHLKESPVEYPPSSYGREEVDRRKSIGRETKKPKEKEIIKETHFEVEEFAPSYWDNFKRVLVKKKEPFVLQKSDQKIPKTRVFEPKPRIAKQYMDEQEVSPVPGRRVKFIVKLRSIFTGKKPTLFEDIVGEEKSIGDKEGKVKLAQPIKFSLFKHILRSLSFRDSPIYKKKKLIEKDLRFRFLRTGNYMDVEKTPHISSDMLKKEAERIHKILTKQKALKLYKPTLIGIISNLTVREISYALIDLFPDIFRNLYNNMRSSNTKILSNTYVNIMVFSTLVTPLIGLFLFPPLFFMQGNPISLVIVKSIFMSIIVGITTFLTFYYYPTMKTKERQRNINTNLPFAVNHMSAVSSSSVPPTALFKLISSSHEYGEICIESEKINQFISIFGYDLITAIRSVAETTPSKAFKEFLEGIISTIESGGNLDEYLSDKSKESLLNYEIERQKYTETISAFSDVYTGILIAAPLFFVAALSLISILGGEIGGVSVDTIIGMGTYIVIPLLNIIFIVFLEVSQPES
ncbi:MAG: type II secretion system F family protein [Candidatus Woesearchaeota archaeon]